MLRDMINLRACRQNTTVGYLLGTGGMSVTALLYAPMKMIEVDKSQQVIQAAGLMTIPDYELTLRSRSEMK